MQGNSPYLLSNDQVESPQSGFSGFFQDQALQNDTLETNSLHQKQVNRCANNPIKLFVGGVPPDMKKGELYDLFQESVSQVPEWPLDVKATNISCHHGFGFIDVSGIEEVKLRELLKKVQLVYNGRKFDARVAIDRKFARQKMMKNKDHKLLVNYIPPEIKHADMQEYFSKLGTLDRTYVAYDPQTGKHKGFGFVIFENLEDAIFALNMKTHKIGKHVVQVNKNMLKNEFVDNNQNNEFNSWEGSTMSGNTNSPPDYYGYGNQDYYPMQDAHYGPTRQHHYGYEAGPSPMGFQNGHPGTQHYMPQRPPPQGGMMYHQGPPPSHPHPMYPRQGPNPSYAPPPHPSYNHGPGNGYPPRPMHPQQGPAYPMPQNYPVQSPPMFCREPMPAHPNGHPVDPHPYDYGHHPERPYDHHGYERRPIDRQNTPFQECYGEQGYQYPPDANYSQPVPPHYYSEQPAYPNYNSPQYQEEMHYRGIQANAGGM